MLQGRLQDSGHLDQDGHPKRTLIFDHVDGSPAKEQRQAADLSSARAAALRNDVTTVLNQLTKSWAAHLPEYFTVQQIADRLCTCEKGEKEEGLEGRRKNAIWTIQHHIKDRKTKDGVKPGALAHLVQLDKYGVPITKPGYRFLPIQPDPVPDELPQL
jgi:hypothetical protein